VAMNSITRLNIVGTPNVKPVSEMMAPAALSRLPRPVSETAADAQRKRQVVVIVLERLRRIGGQLHPHPACHEISLRRVREPASPANTIPETSAPILPKNVLRLLVAFFSVRIGFSDL
jgi:hypothetical protein